jgi:hypothetical protein
VAPVAALFVRARSVYKGMPRVDCWDEARDARKWPGGAAIVAHPPCRGWGRYEHWSHHTEAERQLATWSIDQVRKHGGVVEHPATSKLWTEAKLPAPGARDEFGGFVLVVFQSWWGHKAPKPTILYVVGVEPADVPPIPFELGIPEGRIENMSRAQREETPPAFAAWLVELARRCAR